MLYIDINCDLGESFPDDQLLMPYISSANIACGGHAGDTDIMRSTIESSMHHGLRIGAHPGYNDRINFGRKEQALGADELYDLITTQVQRIKKITEESGGLLEHVKPHGALYNLSARSPEVAATIAQAIRDVDSGLCLYGLSGSFSITAAREAGLETRQEVFADRRYDDNGQLLSRLHPEAMIGKTEVACGQVLQMVRDNSVTTVSGKILPVAAETICIHGDAAGAAALAAQLFHFLAAHAIGLQKK